MTTTSLSPRKTACCSWSTGATAPRSAGEPMAKLKALKASYDLATTVERFE